MDLERRLRAGESARVEDYVARFPELADRLDALFELVVREYELRRHLPGVTLAAYAERFPGLAARLLERSTADESLREQSTLAPFGPPSGPSQNALAPALRYRPVKFHAQGGIGEVHVAHDEELNRDVALKLIQERLRPPAPVSAKRLAELIELLDDDSFEVRQKASADLLRLGVAARPALQKARARASLEVRLRAARLLAELERLGADREHLRALRSIEVLERGRGD